MSTADDLRLIARVARLYHETGYTQTEIAERLSLSQAKVSRLLKQAVERRIVTITVRIPTGVNAELEEALERRYGLAQAIVVDSTASEDLLLTRDLGEACAYYLETTLRPGSVLGVSAWSATLLAAANALTPATSASGTRVVQLLGGVGSPTAAMHATELTKRFATALRGEALLLPAPGVVGSAAARKVLEADEHVAQTLALFPKVDVALVGIGSITPSAALASSGNIFGQRDLDAVQAAGGVGDMCLRFFDRFGKPVGKPQSERVIGMSLDQLRAAPRTVAVAGGTRKVEAISGALASGIVDVLITDASTAAAVAEASQSEPRTRRAPRNREQR